MMNGGSTLLLTLCEPPSNDIVGLGRTKQPSMKRRNEDIGIQSCLSSNSEYALPSTKKLRRYVSTESRSSKLRWRPVLEDQQDGSLVSRHRMIKEGGEELESSEVTPMDTWYSVSIFCLNERWCFFISSRWNTLVGFFKCRCSLFKRCTLCFNFRKRNISRCCSTRALRFT